MEPAVPGEQRLRQRRITDFLNLGAPAEPPGSTLGWPTTDNAVASPRAQLSSLTDGTGGGSPWEMSTMNCTEDCGNASPLVMVGGGNNEMDNTITCTENVMGNNIQDEVIRPTGKTTI